MSYAGTKESVKSALVGIGININATELSECSVEVLTTECNKV